jgi:hypothetical protein
MLTANQLRQVAARSGARDIANVEMAANPSGARQVGRHKADRGRTPSVGHGVLD